MCVLFGEMPLQCLLPIFLILLSFQSFLKKYIPYISPLEFLEYLLLFCSFCFHVLNGSFTGQKVFILVKPNLPIFSFMDPAFDVKSKNALLTPDPSDFLIKVL